MSAFPQGHDHQLHASGLTGRSLVAPGGHVHLPFDLARQVQLPLGLKSLVDPRVRRAADAPFRVDWHAHAELHVLNGMGVALGDNLIGVSVLAQLKAWHPQLCIRLHHAAHLPVAVRQLHAMPATPIATCTPLPQRLDAIPAHAAIVDIGDFAYWPQFNAMPMVDFFAWALGIAAHELSAAARRNAWLRSLPLPPLPAPWRDTPYALLAPRASTPLRDIPTVVSHALVAAMSRRYRLPVLGFAELDHPAYRTIAPWSRNTPEFLAWIAGASVLVSTDSAAVHAAAGFDVPTLAGFVSIDPALRTAGYPHCRAVDLRRPGLDGLHHTDDADLVRLAHAAWEALDLATLDWPAL